ncbi:hypothetical protein O181_022981 [Austropuccinia psidii MF-1]|uniref:Uncharacterized protein n=1 Tax=Austropuccinia psidii MF-1 TaxID=1389203 RepID=A0A9Q3GX83_9BASI|nr:hypothetical protein [Austropuccinia psidii MF-1]
MLLDLEALHSNNSRARNPKKTRRSGPSRRLAIASDSEQSTNLDSGSEPAIDHDGKRALTTGPIEDYQEGISDDHQEDSSSAGSDSSTETSYSSSSGSSACSTDPHGPELLPFQVGGKLYQLVFFAHQKLKNRSWVALWKNLHEVDKIICSSSIKKLRSFGIILPILARLIDKIEFLVTQDLLLKSKAHRHSLSADNAKALSVLIQKWPKFLQKERIVAIREIVEQHNKPQVIAGVLDDPTDHVLFEIELVLLGLSSKISLAKLSLTSVPPAILELSSIVGWYLKFGSIQWRDGHSNSSQTDDVKLILSTIKCLDLSSNQIHSLPSRLPYILSGLKVLTLTNNPIVALPVTSIRWRALRRLKLSRRTIRRPTSRTLVRLALSSSPSPPTLVECCLKRLKSCLPITPNLPPHLFNALVKGHQCQSCSRFLWPSACPLYESFEFENLTDQRWHRVILGPSFFCMTCITLHFTCPQAELDDMCCQCFVCSLWDGPVLSLSQQPSSWCRSFEMINR